MQISDIKSPEVLWHIVLISLKPCVSEELKKKAIEKLQTLAEDCGGHRAGILYLHVGENLDPRKGVQLVEFAQFRDNDALQAFRAHPKHVSLTNLLSHIADWQVGDLMLPQTPWQVPSSPEFTTTSRN